MKIADISVYADLDASSMADTIWNNLPLTGEASIWGDEIYFGTNISVVAEENASDVVKSGELAYWPPGRAFCIFFGATPVSVSNESRAASPVNVFGKVDGDEHIFRNVSTGMLVQIEAVE
ncbi:MAG: hypothetical protein FI698_02360 [SAR202 cluster bacterium]|nr:hypothetical protein [SAR202 cluster bacterium]